MFWYFGHEAYGTSAPWPGIEPVPPALEEWILNHQSPGEISK